MTKALAAHAPKRAAFEDLHRKEFSQRESSKQPLPMNREQASKAPSSARSKFDVERCVVAAGEWRSPLLPGRGSRAWSVSDLEVEDRTRAGFEILNPHLLQLPLAFNFLERFRGEFLHSFAIGVVGLRKHDAAGINIKPGDHAGVTAHGRIRVNAFENVAGLSAFISFFNRRWTGQRRNSSPRSPTQKSDPANRSVATSPAVSGVACSRSRGCRDRNGLAGQPR